MQITKQDLSHKFKPFSVTFSVETETERAALYKLFGYDISIPKWIREQEGLTSEQQITLESFMREIALFLSVKQ